MINRNQLSISTLMPCWWREGSTRPHQPEKSKSTEQQSLSQEKSTFVCCSCHQHNRKPNLSSTWEYTEYWHSLTTVSSCQQVSSNLHCSIGWLGCHLSWGRSQSQKWLVMDCEWRCSSDSKLDWMWVSWFDGWVIMELLMIERLYQAHTQHTIFTTWCTHNWRVWKLMIVISLFVSRNQKKWLYCFWFWAYWWFTDLWENWLYNWSNTRVHLNQILIFSTSMMLWVFRCFPSLAIHLFWAHYSLSRFSFCFRWTLFEYSKHWAGLDS